MSAKQMKSRLKLWAAAVVLLCLPILVVSTVQAQDDADAAVLLKTVDVLDLDTAVRVALLQNPSLAAAQARVAQAAEALRQAKSAYWPRLDASFSASRVDMAQNEYEQQAAFSALFGTSLDDPETYYQLGLSASWLLFDGFTRKFSVLAAKYGESLTAAARDDVRRLLVSSVAGAFLSVQYAQENIIIAEADLAFNQRLLTEAQLRYDVGAGALSDVLNFEIKANAAETQRIQAVQSLKIGMVGLAAVMGLPGTALPDHLSLAPLKPASTEELGTPELETLLYEAYRSRPDLQQIDWAVRQAEAGVEAARGNYYPSLSLSADYRGERAGDTGFGSDDFGNTLAVGVSYNIFSGWLYDAQYQEAKVRLKEVEKNSQSAKLTVTADVRKALTRVLSAQEQLALQQASTQLVRRNRDLVEKEYKAGVGALVRLNEAQRDLTAAQVRLAAARVALRQAWYDLRTATGEILKLFDG